MRRHVTGLAQARAGGASRVGESRAAAARRAWTRIARATSWAASLPRASSSITSAQLVRAGGDGCVDRGAELGLPPRLGPARRQHVDEERVGEVRTRVLGVRCAADRAVLGGRSPGAARCARRASAPTSVVEVVIALRVDRDDRASRRGTPDRPAAVRSASCPTERSRAQDRRRSRRTRAFGEVEEDWLRGARQGVADVHPDAATDGVRRGRHHAPELFAAEDVVVRRDFRQLGREMRDEEIELTAEWAVQPDRQSARPLRLASPGAAAARPRRTRTSSAASSSARWSRQATHAVGSAVGTYIGQTLSGSAQPVLLDLTEGSRTSRPPAILCSGTLGSGRR